MAIPDLDKFFPAYRKENPNHETLLELNLDKVNHWAIAGNSGSGKSYALTYFLSVLKHMSDLIIIDPKFDTPSRWARENHIAVIHPAENRSKSDFVSQVNEQLSQCATHSEKASYLV